MSTNSPPPDSSFMPRREFRRDTPQREPKTFSLLALSGSNCIRLYSFPLHVVVHLRRFLDQDSLISAYREDVSNNFCEFLLEGKIWSSPKSPATERLLLDILAIIYQHGHIYLSTVDYGREADDRLAMAFSKPSVQPDHASSPGHSKVSFSDPRSVGNRVPFALSFPSATLLRVIAPPLDLTPAILQAVRGAWPRGVVSEKKIGNDTFEFKLKGYRWFQQDTFATDSLRHILTLLSALDAQSFTLLSSISLTNNRSRVKDLWLFTGPAPLNEEGAFPDSPVPSHRAIPQRDVEAFNGHKRMATEPIGSPPPSYQHHARAVTDAARNGQPSPSPSQSSQAPHHVLRKPAPRAQLPVSVSDQLDVEGEGEYRRVDLPSTIPSGIENMTGVGAGLPLPPDTQTPDVFYTTSPFQASPTAAHDIRDDGVATSSPPRGSPEPVPVESLPQSAATTPPVTATPPGAPEPQSALLSSRVFRDSAFSSCTDTSADIPIKWTGVGTDAVQEEDERLGPDIPGGWQPTPVEERTEPVSMDIALEQSQSPTHSVHDVHGRVSSPVFSQRSAEHHSQAGLIGTFPSIEPQDKEKEKEGAGVNTPPQREGSNGQQGWVLVDVEKQASGHSRSHSTTGGDGSSSREPKSPLPKSVIIVDPSKKKDEAPPGSRVRRFFSLSRKDSKRVVKDHARRKSRLVVDDSQESEDGKNA
ncbi:hypothetical protein CYLTODRAFT_449492 [Cylindrobasidium torrendii FP15055 ss-10]|uniref:Uncharacterized protein n=1 Tax=Cylindrobasidium torrendii FP15055 ss-10 TaxID=1314674 RepID=A0A0D7BQE8_9AGAR|nr:hypothetical protein CYLTODRAFT_449492 [Cylindrobasidium torrendii FP15055 ss-10]